MRSTSPGVDVLHRLLHAGEALVEQLPAEQVADLLVGLAGLGGAPVVGVELADGAAGVGRQRVELHLAEAGVVGVLVGQRGALGLQRARQQLADLLQRAVEAVVALQAAAPLPHLAGQVVEPAPALHAAAEQLPQRGARRGALHDVAADGVERGAQVDGRGEGVGAVGVRAVGVPAIVSGHAADTTPRVRGTATDVEDGQGAVAQVRDVGPPAVGGHRDAGRAVAGRHGGGDLERRGVEHLDRVRVDGGHVAVPAVGGERDVLRVGAGRDGRHHRVAGRVGDRQRVVVVVDVVDVRQVRVGAGCCAG